MPFPRPQFTIWRLMTGVAVLAVACPFGESVVRRPSPRTCLPPLMILYLMWASSDCLRIGGVVAGYLTLASGEVFSPGTMQWALRGGAYGALFGLPVAALVGGLIGLIGAVSRSLGIGHATTTDKGRPADQGGKA